MSRDKCVSLSCLFDAGLVGIQQRSSLYVLRDELAAHSGDLLPVVQHHQSQMLLSLLLQTWRGDSNGGRDSFTRSN